MASHCPAHYTIRVNRTQAGTLPAIMTVLIPFMVKYKSEKIQAQSLHPCISRQSRWLQQEQHLPCLFLQDSRSKQQSPILE